SRSVAAQRFAPLGEVLDLRAVFRRTVEWHLNTILIGERNVEARAEDAEFFLVELFLLVRDVLSFARFAKAVALDGTGEDYGWAARVFGRGFVGGVDLTRIVTTEAQATKNSVAERLDEFQQARVGAEETLTNVIAGRD